MNMNGFALPPPRDEQLLRLYRLEAAGQRRLLGLLPELQPRLAAVAEAVARELLESPEIRLLVEGSEELRQFQTQLARHLTDALGEGPSPALLQRWRELGRTAQGLGLSPGFITLAGHRLLRHLAPMLQPIPEELVALLFLALDALISAHAHASLAARDESVTQAERYAASLEETLAERDRRLCEIIPSDPLTGLLTPARFQDELERTLGLSRRRGEPFTLIRLHAHGLKACLERDGRQATDEVLFLIAQTLRETFRKTDLLCRLEDGVFMVAMPNASEKQAVEITNRMIRSFTAREHRGVTFALGMAQTGPEHHLPHGELLALAEATVAMVLPLARERPGFYVRRASSGGG